MGRREQKRDLTRQQMLDAAATLFVEKGYENTTLEDVTERANVSKGTFYYHFDSKETLVVELRRWALAGTVERAYKALSEHQAPLTVLERLVLERAAFTERHPELSRVFFTQRVQKAFFREEHSFEDEQGRPRLIRKATYELICEGQKCGQIRADISPIEAAGMISAIVLHAQGAWLSSDRTSSLVEKVHRLLHAVLDGVGTKNYRDNAPCFNFQTLTTETTQQPQPVQAVQPSSAKDPTQPVQLQQPLQQFPSM